jgi:hypothetical protein
MKMKRTNAILVVVGSLLIIAWYAVHLLDIPVRSDNSVVAGMLAGLAVKVGGYALEILDRLEM